VIPQVEPEGMLFRKPVSTFRDNVLGVAFVPTKRNKFYVADHKWSTVQVRRDVLTNAHAAKVADALDLPLVSVVTTLTRMGLQHLLVCSSYLQPRC
jgi:hypothetical protein